MITDIDHVFDDDPDSAFVHREESIMKFFHLSDLHLGKRVNGFSMLEDQKNILDQILIPSPPTSRVWIRAIAVAIHARINWIAPRVRNIAQG